MSKDKITIAEYAELRGVSQQSVYKRLNGSLNPYLIEENGQKYLKIEVLTPEEKEKYEAEVEEVVEPVVKPFNNPTYTDILEEQIAEKDEVIKDLLRKIDVLQEQNGSLTKIIENNQLLLAQQQTLQQQLLLTTSPNPVNNEENTPSPDTGTDDTEPDTADTPKEERKKGIFGFFIRKKR
jgi:hypothetical protein